MLEENLTLTDVTPDIFSLFNSSVSPGTTDELLNGPLILKESEILKVTAADANRLHVVASILEINRENI